MDSESSSAPRAGSASEKEDQMVVQSFSCRSGELVKALVLEMADYELWITEKLLQRFGLSKSRAFELAVKNLEEATPSPLESHLAILGKRQDSEAVNKRLKQSNYEICSVKAYEWGPVIVWVTKLRNDQGLVELEPYPLWGGTLGLQIWEGPVRKCLYPMPKTRDESEILDPYKAEERGSVCELVEESRCFADVCWNCRKKPEGAQLLKCGKCKDVKYCSEECQTLSWRKDHKLECDARKQAAQGSRTVKDGKKDKGAQKALKDHQKELGERLAQTIAENLRDVI
ncbi:hypothetical protein KFL_002510140 [Klebsormidium nitens]|uniref:MYND-type domain-containing protein n=1 Tax=Klebsormidium nitens TaxID=105231 RepID=A0A1Y1IAK1_KLENI|nr:hypothetical protein KFL_002510140 [Klebsormidium nitens]|eukprot:GAQ85737.1 hypothetical protein KFL_002510140 [Klebsormidium nitens]